MSFLNPLLLIGCAAAVLPLLIYLLTRDRGEHPRITRKTRTASGPSPL